jgi:hypothetical protein
MKQLKSAIGEAFVSSGLTPLDDAALEKFSAAFVRSYAPCLVGWTQPSQIAMLADDQNGSSAMFWSKRDCDGVREFMGMPGMPDDVPLFSAPVVSPAVKPLTFTLHGEGDEQTYIAQSIIGTFAVWERRQGGFVMKAPPNYENEVVGDQIEDAFAAANTAFSAIIQSVLT